MCGLQGSGRDLRPAVPAAIDDLVWRMLMKEPRSRPADGAAILAELDALGDGMGDPASRPPPSLHHSVLTLGEIRLVSVVTNVPGKRVLRGRGVRVARRRSSIPPE